MAKTVTNEEIQAASQVALAAARDLSDLAGRLERDRPLKIDNALDAIGNLGLAAEAAIAVQKWLIAIADAQARTERFERLSS